MNDYVTRFRASPASFKKSFAVLTAAWVIHPIFVFSLFRNEAAGAHAEIMRMAVVSLSLGVLLFLIKKWARALVVVGNLFIVIYDLLFLIVTPPNSLSTVLCLMVVALTLVGTYWLFAKDSRDYFNQVNPAIEPV